MITTNNFGLPEVVLKAIQNDPYDSGGADRSVTQLIGSPRIHLLRRKHYHEMTQDATESIWSLLGRSAHAILENGIKAGGEAISEERLFAEVDGWVISGALDIQKVDETHVDIIDFKVTSAWSAVFNPDGKEDWINQQNVYAWLVEFNKLYTVRSLSICAIYRDWREKDAQADVRYPAAPMQMINLPLWSYAERESYVRERVRLHQEAQMSYDLGNELPECTPTERWMRGEKWSVLKPGGKKAVRTVDTEQEARDIAAASPALYVAHRPGKPGRCVNDWCGVAQWCNQYQNELKEQYV